ncbi:HNH endonuclease [Halobacteria archaeon HArc-gm2]|nr:HNH endonuclease [Halobacteria archaeon HArc-gm2]
MYSCPTCGRDFDSHRGLSVHHSRVHDDQLPNRACDHCEESFYCDYERKYCSDDCHDEAVSFEGRSNPNYGGGKERTTCELCDQSFEYYPSEKDGVYCPNCVENASWRDPPVISGTDHHSWNGGKLTLSCDVCEATVERYPSAVNGEATLCDRECFEAWLSEEFTGDGHPNWLGGGTGSYGKGWNQVRKRALERDGHACVMCETGADELGRNPDVHHLIPVRVFVESPLLTIEDAHTLDNVVSLCPACHRRAEFGHHSRAELRWRAGVRAAPC